MPLTLSIQGAAIFLKERAHSRNLALRFSAVITVLPGSALPTSVWEPRRADAVAQVKGYSRATTGAHSVGTAAGDPA